MNCDTTKCISLASVEQGLRTLGHDWRNVLNGINLRVNAASLEDDVALRTSDLGEALQLISSASDYLAKVSRQLAAPIVEPIPYPADFFLEDLAANLEKQTVFDRPPSQWISCETEPLSRKIMVDFNAATGAISELIENARRYLPEGAVLTLRSREHAGSFVLSWSELPPHPPSIEAWGKSPFCTTERGHLGLGIYFANRVIEAHRGKLAFAYSPATNLLLTTITLPLATL